MGGGGENSYELCREYSYIPNLFLKFVTFFVSFNPQVMGWVGGGGLTYIWKKYLRDHLIILKPAPVYILKSFTTSDIFILV